MERRDILHRVTEIALPAEFTVSMTMEEASVRARVAKRVEGVTFRIRDPLEPSLEGYAQKLQGRVIGTTTAENLDALKIYARKVAKIMPFKLPTPKKTP